MSRRVEKKGQATRFGSGWGSRSPMPNGQLKSPNPTRKTISQTCKTMRRKFFELRKSFSVDCYSFKCRPINLTPATPIYSGLSLRPRLSRDPELMQFPRRIHSIRINFNLWLTLTRGHRRRTQDAGARSQFYFYFIFTLLCFSPLLTNGRRPTPIGIRICGHRRGHESVKMRTD